MSLGAYSYIRNGIQNGYPFLEAYLAWKPFADEFIVIDGMSNDGTWEALTSLQKNWPHLKIIRQNPRYLVQPKDEQGLGLGQIFEHSKSHLNTEWQVMVQADCVFHAESIKAIKIAIKKTHPKTAAFALVRHQYRWNWQEMYWKCILNLCTRKDKAQVAGDGLNCTTNGYIDKRLIPIFKEYPIADCAWCFWGNLWGKVTSCSEIWPDKETDVQTNDFAWYNKELKRNFKDDYEQYRLHKKIPEIFTKTESPFKNKIPANLHHWFGKLSYDTAKIKEQKNTIHINEKKLLQPEINKLSYYIHKYYKYFLRR